MRLHQAEMNIDPPGTRIAIPAELLVRDHTFVLAGVVEPAWDKSMEIRVRVGTQTARLVSAETVGNDGFRIEVEGKPTVGPAQLGVTLGDAWAVYDVRER